MHTCCAFYDSEWAKYTVWLGSQLKITIKLCYQAVAVFAILFFVLHWCCKFVYFFVNICNICRLVKVIQLGWLLIFWSCLSPDHLWSTNHPLRRENALHILVNILHRLNHFLFHQLSCIILRYTLNCSIGMAQFVSHFAQPGDPEYAPPVPEVETPVRLFYILQFLFWSFFGRSICLIEGWIFILLLLLLLAFLNCLNTN